jgi:hypothetical protein
LSSQRKEEKEEEKKKKKKKQLNFIYIEKPCYQLYNLSLIETPERIKT